MYYPKLNISMVIKETCNSVIFIVFLIFNFLPIKIVGAQELQPQKVAISAWKVGDTKMPAPGDMLGLSAPFNPATIKGIKFHPQDLFLFDFIIHPGEENLSGDELNKESIKLIKYFMAALTVPEEEMWVNLSPYEKDRIIPKGFGDTEMGRDLLAQDYMLKQLTASLMYPESELGNDFWEKVKEKTFEKYGHNDVPMNTFNKVWIVPQSAVIYQDGNSVYVIESKLKVMLEEDYLALEESIGSKEHGLGDVKKEDLTKITEASSEIIREIIIPELEKEVNQGKTFANLRQISNAVILATWFKGQLMDSDEQFLSLRDEYVDRNKTKGIDIQDKNVNKKIYRQYVEAFKKGVFDFVQEEYDPATQEIIPKKYFSGGAVEKWNGKIHQAETGLDKAMLSYQLEDSHKLRVAFKGVSDANMSVQTNNVIDSLYVDDNGDVRIKLSAFKDDIARGFFEKVEEHGLKRDIFLLGQDARDILLGTREGYLRYYVSNDIDVTAENEFSGDISPLIINIGRINEVPLSENDLSVNRLIIKFDRKSSDPIVYDSYGGLVDLLSRKARFVGSGVDSRSNLMFRFADIVHQIVALDLSPDQELSQRANELLLWIENTLKPTIGNESLTNQDRNLLKAAEAYRVLMKIHSAPENYEEHTTELWHLLEEWTEILGDINLSEFTVGDLFGYKNINALNAHFQTMQGLRTELNERVDEDSDYKNIAIDRTSTAEQLAESQRRVELRELSSGDWVISPEFGLISIKTIDGNRITFKQLSQRALINSFSIDATEVLADVESQDESTTIFSEDASLYRWGKRQGRIERVTNEAYNLAGRRAHEQFDIDALALTSAVEIMQERLDGDNELASLYLRLVNQQLSSELSADEMIRILRDMVSEGTTGSLAELRRIVRLAYKETKEDLVKSGVLKFLNQEQELSPGQTEPFMFTGRSVTSDVYFYLITELMESGIGLFKVDVSDMLDAEVTNRIQGAETLLPRSHPGFPYDAFSNLYFAAKQDSETMQQLSDQYAQSLLELVRSKGVEINDIDYIAPVPKKRGEYNQLMPLVDAIALRLGMPVNNDLVEKIEVKSKQKEIKSLVGKGMNVANAYKVIDPDKVKDKTVMIVDDHSGTGLTLMQIQKRLYDAGAKKVVVIALTESPKKNSVNLEIKVKAVSEDSGYGIQLIQDVLNPKTIQELITGVYDSFAYEQAQALDVQAREELGLKVMNKLFGHNLIDAWSTDFSGGMINKTTVENRVKNVFRLFAEEVVKEYLGYNDQPGTISLRTDPQKTLQYLRAVAQGGSYDGVDMSNVKMVLSDYDNTLADTFTQLGVEPISVIIDILSQGKKFALVSQQSIEEMQQLFLDPMKEYLDQNGLGYDMLQDLFLFPACSNRGYDLDTTGDMLTPQRLDEVSSLFTEEHLARLRSYEMDIQPAYVGNREDGILTYYFQHPLDRVAAMHIMQLAVIAEGIPAKVVRNGYLRMRIIHQNLIKTRARDYMLSRFPEISMEETAVLGDNFDPDDPLSDIGLVKEGRNDAVKTTENIVFHRELVREFKQKVPLREILLKRNIPLEDGLRGYEAKIFVNENTNIYWHHNGEIISRDTFDSLISPDSLIYFLADGSAIFIEDSRDLDSAISPLGEGNPDDLYVSKRFDLSNGDEKILQWLRMETAFRGHIQIVDLTDDLADSFKLTLEQARRKMISTFKMVQVDGEPNRFINFRDTPEGFVQKSIRLQPETADDPIIGDTKGGIDLNQELNSIEVIGDETIFDFKINAHRFNNVNIDGLVPIILNVEAN